MSEGGALPVVAVILLCCKSRYQSEHGRRCSAPVNSCTRATHAERCGRAGVHALLHRRTPLSRILWNEGARWVLPSDTKAAVARASASDACSRGRQDRRRLQRGLRRIATVAACRRACARIAEGLAHASRGVADVVVRQQQPAQLVRLAEHARKLCACGR